VTVILALVEHDGGQVTVPSLEMLTIARRLAEAQGLPLHAIAVGGDGPTLAEHLAGSGVAALHRVSHPDLGEYAPAAWAQGAVEVAAATGTRAVLAAGTERGNEVLAHVGAKTGRPMAANCVAVDPGEPYRVTRLRWGGSLLEEARLGGSPKLLTTAPHAVAAEPAAEARTPVVHEVTPALSARDLAVRVTGRTAAGRGGVALADARVVVTGGRGVGSAEGFRVIEELAGLLGGAVGCSRAVTSLGWRPHSDQIGQTGTRVAPELYIACGVSGAIQHMVGCKAARHILAINTDPEAPIMAIAHSAVIGDLHEVIPAVVKQLRARKGL
jgi:electron transfer flavoprotein alpha subunit